MVRAYLVSFANREALLRSGWHIFGQTSSDQTGLSSFGTIIIPDVLCFLTSTPATFLHNRIAHREAEPWALSQEKAAFG